MQIHTELLLLLLFSYKLDKKQEVDKVTFLLFPFPPLSILSCFYSLIIFSERSGNDVIIPMASIIIFIL